LHTRARPLAAGHGGSRTPALSARRGGREERLSFFLKLAVLSLLTPAYFTVGTLSLTPSKVLFLVSVPVLTINLLRGAYGKVMAVDVLIFLYVLWMALAMFVNHDARVAVEFVGSNIIIILGGYLTARAFVRNKAHFIALTKFLALIILVSLPFVFSESVLGAAPAISQWLGSLPEIDSHGNVMNSLDDRRMGLWRAQFVFQHPIHFGLFCSAGFSLCYIGLKDHVGDFSRLVLSLGVLAACFFSVSSGPVLALMCQIGLIAWLRLVSTDNRWKILTAGLCFMYLIIELASTRVGIYAVVERLSFSPETAYLRRVLFEFGTEQIARTPVFGVGFNPWPLPFWMTGSLDNFWLMLAVVFGLPTFLFFSAAFLTALIRIGRQDFTADPDLMKLRQAWIFTMISLILTLATVAVWGEMYSFVLFIFGSGLWMASVAAEAPAAVAEPERRSARREAPAYTRFPPRPRANRIGS
jgi:hypothetical protein